MSEGDLSWADVHFRSLNQKLIEYILSDKNNFGPDNIIKQSVIDLYGIECPNNHGGGQTECSGNGKCFRSIYN
jgi:hypothetical protein